MYDYLMLKKTLMVRRPGRILGVTEGIGYEVRVSAMTEEADRESSLTRPVFLRSRMDTNSGVFTHYGFLTLKEREVFDALVKVKSVGWDTALKILGMGWDCVIQFAAAGKADEFLKVKGIGAKAAARLVDAKEAKQLIALEKTLLPKTTVD